MSSGIMVAIFMDVRCETKAELRSVFWRRFSTLSLLNPEQLEVVVALHMSSLCVRVIQKSEPTDLAQINGATTSKSVRRSVDGFSFILAQFCCSFSTFLCLSRQPGSDCRVSYHALDGDALCGMSSGIVFIMQGAVVFFRYKKWSVIPGIAW
jgi:hypothetical protein